MNKNIYCENIYLKDSKGNIRFRISGDSVDNTFLELMDERGFSLLSLGIRDDGNIYVRISDKKATGRGVYLGNPEGQPTISLNGEGSTPVVNICLQQYSNGEEGAHFSVVRSGKVVVEEDF